MLPYEWNNLYIKALLGFVDYFFSPTFPFINLINEIGTFWLIFVSFVFNGKLVFTVTKPETNRIVEIDAKKTVISTGSSIKISYDFGFKGWKNG